MVGSCLVCKVPAYEKCSHCRDAYYCCSEHQQDDWDSHRARCRSYQIMMSTNLGRYLVAARDLERGDLVLREEPLLTGPSPDATVPLCVSCYCPPPTSPAGDLPLCPRGCGWPVCGQACADDPRHQPECQLVANGQAKVDVESALSANQPVYRALMIVRALLLKDTNPEAYKKLCAMEAHCIKRRSLGLWEAQRESLVNFIWGFFGMNSNFSADNILVMVGVLQINTYPVLVPQKQFVAVYDEASFIEHNCVPNVAKVFSSDGTLELIAAVPILHGDHLSICYVNPRLGTAPRRRLLADELLQCLCQRCKDPSENNTDFSSLICQYCGGLVQPLQPIAEAVPKSGAVWRCTACSSDMTAAAVDTVLSEASVAASDAQADAADAAAFLVSPAARRLARNHYLLLEARVAVACGAEPHVTRSDARLATDEVLLRDLLWLVSTLLPGETGLRGKLYYHLHATVEEREMRPAKVRELNGEDLYEEISETPNLLQEAMLCLQPFSEGTPEHQLWLKALEKC